MTKKQFRIEMIYRNHNTRQLKRILKGDVDYIVYEARCAKCNETILFFPAGDPYNNNLNIRGPVHCL